MTKSTLMLSHLLVAGSVASATNITMIVGTYTNAGSTGIYSYSFNQESGEHNLLNEIAVNNPSYLEISENGDRIYSVSENAGDNAIISAFCLDSNNGDLSFINSQYALDDGPCYISTNEKCVFIANYDKGSIAAFPIGKNGELLAASYFEQFSDCSIDPKRQKSSHLHCVKLSPDKKYLFATNLGGDCIYSYEIIKNGTSLRKIDKYKIDIEKGAGPRHLVFSTNGKQAYLITEIAGKVMTFNYEKGKLSLIQTIIADSNNGKGSADIQISPDGKFLYSSNRIIGDGITVFSIDRDGILSVIGYNSTGIHPRNFAITPNGKFLLVACRDDNKIEVYSRNIESGMLQNTGKSIILSKPVCIKFGK